MRKLFSKAALFLIALIACMGILFVGCKKKSAGTAAQSASSYSDENTEFTVISFTPEDELPASVKFPSIQVQFSKPVVALQKLGEPSDKSDVFTIEPPIAGVFRWYGTSLLSFESSESVIPQKEYTIKINPKLTSTDGTKISGQTEYKFHSEELTITSVVPGYEEVKKGNYVDSEDVPVELARDIAVFFNSPVNASFVAKELTVEKSGTLEAFTFTATQESENCVRLKLKETPPEYTTLYITLPKGSSADKDCYPTSEEQTRSFMTLRPFSVERFRTEYLYLDSKYANPVAFIMSHQIKQGSEAEVAKWISTTPAMPVTADNIYVNGTNIIVHSLPVTFGSEYKIKLSGEAHDIYGRKLGTGDEHSVTVPQARSYASYKDYGFKMLESQFAPKLVFEHQNIKSGSAYSLVPIALANGTLSYEGEAIKVELNPENIPQNKRIIEAVDLTPALQKTSSGYRGTVAFNANMKYEYRYTNWYTEEVETRSSTSENTQYIQVTDLGMTVRYGYNKILVLVTSLSSGKPVANAEVNAYMINSSTYRGVFEATEGTPACKAKTDANGFAVISVPKNMLSDRTNGYLYVEAKTKDDRALFQPDIYDMWRTAVISTDSPGNAEEQKQVTFIFTDRGLYKPGETVTFRGIDKTLKTGNYSSYANSSYTVKLTNGSWYGETYATLTGTTSVNGGFWGTFKLPEDLEPGTYSIEYYRAGADRYDRETCNIQVQFFERLRFEANASFADITYYSGDTLNAEVKAQYLGGGSMGNAHYSGYWTREPVGFYAKGNTYSNYTFGPKQGYDGRTSINYADGYLNGEGSATEQQQTGGEKLKGMAYSYRFEATVTDSGNQAISTSTKATVHPSKFYIGLSSPKNVNGFAKKGDTITFDYVCLTPDETAPLAKDLPTGAKKKLKVELLRYEWKQIQQVSWNGQINTRYEREMITEDEKTLDLSGTATPSSFTVVPPKGGQYILRVSTQDARENEIITERSFYVTSSDWYWFNRDNAEEITMTPDRELYAVGDTAHILMQSPLEKGKYLMTIEREGIVSERVIDIDVPTTVLDVKIEESYVPVMYVTLSSYSVRTENPHNDYDTPDVAKPKGYFGLAALCVDPAFKSFDIKVEQDKPSYRPGEKATITIYASKNGKPVSNAEITLMAVDRGVIDLINYHVANPIEHFYSRYLFPDCVRGGDSRSLLMDPVTYEIKNLVGGDADEGDAKLNERKNFEPTAVFVPSIVTDSNGKATYSFTLPDTLTAYRVTAVGVNNDTFGITETQMDVAEPISVRQVLPRKLRVNDKGEVGVTISNLDASAQNVSVTVNVYDGIEKTGLAQDEDDVQKLPGHALVNGQNTKTISVPSSSTQSLMFSVEAVSQGWITVEYVVKSSLVNERILLPLEIEKPYIFETVTTVGELGVTKEGSSTSEQIVIPANTEDGLGSLYVQLDPTRLGTLTEAVTYVFHYPYGCMEQRSAAVLPLVAFGEYIKVFGLNSEVKNPKRVAEKEIASWKKVQKSDGGFPYWPSGRESNNYVSMRIGEIVALAQKNGISTKGIDVDALHRYIKNLATGSGKDGAYWYNTAQAIYIAECLSDGKDDFNSKLAEIAESSENLNALAYCGLAYLKCGNKSKAQEVGKKIRRYTKYSTRGIDLTDSINSYWSFLNGKSEDYALLLQFFSELEPESDINQHLVYELLEIQKMSHGYWTSTAQTARVLIAINSYIKQESLENTNFTAEALLNKKDFVSGTFKGVAADPVEKTVDFNESPVKEQKRGTELPLTFNAKGDGKLFYTVSMKYAIPPAEQTARDEGICIFTEIIDVKTGEVVTGDKLVAGNIYRQKVYVSSTRLREFVAVRATIPAGCEVLNAAFVTTGSLPPAETDEDEDDWESWYRNYNWGLSNQAIYDSEVQYFWNYFPAGNQQVEFLFRATRKGTYNTPSSTAECMYQSEIFGRSNGKVWTIE